ncbi:hypothetical protein D3C72_2486370 [compost metagenome]
MQGVGAGVEAHGVLAAEVRGEFRLEGLHVGAVDVLPRADGGEDGRVHLGLKRVVLGLEIENRDHA